MKVFKISLPGNDIKSARLKDEVLDSSYSSPKVNTIAKPPHLGIIHLNWQTTTPLSQGTVKTIYSFPHGYSRTPTALATFSFDNGSTQDKGILPFQYGSLGIITIETDPTNVNIKYISIDLGSTTIPAFIMQIRFYVFAERGYDS